MGRTYKPKVKLYTEASINAAINEVININRTVYKTAKKYHMSISMLRRVLEKQGLITRKKTRQKK